MSENVKLIAPPGYGPVAPLDKQKHAGLGLKSERDYRWCAGLNAVLVSVAEFGRAALDYPVAFIREPKGELVPVAVLGLQAKQNLFVDGAGRWRTHAYVPAYVRRHPFCIVSLPAAQSEETKSLVCVQEDQLTPVEKPLFDATGEPTEGWPPILKLLEAVESARQQTLAFTRRLETSGLLAPFDALAMARGGQQLRLQGLLRVDEQKLNKLGGKDLKALLSRGELRAIYAHALSLENFARLLDLTPSPTPPHKGEGKTNSKAT